MFFLLELFVEFVLQQLIKLMHPLFATPSQNKFRLVAVRSAHPPVRHRDPAQRRS